MKAEFIKKVGGEVFKQTPWIEMQSWECAPFIWFLVFVYTTKVCLHLMNCLWPVILIIVGLFRISLRTNRTSKDI